VLEQASDAERFQRDLVAAFTRSAFATERRMAIAIIGAGATGVELSAELLQAEALVQQSVTEDQRFHLDVHLIEAGPRILAGLPEKISSKAHAALEAKGVHVHVATPVRELRAGRVIADGAAIDADLIVWAAGIKAADRTAGYGLIVNPLNQFVVNERLETSMPDVFALGDCAACAWGDRQVPARAQAAHQQAVYLAKALVARLQGHAFGGTFAFRDYGSLVSLGEKRGFGSLMGRLGGRQFLIEGLLAKAMYMLLHLDHHRAILGLGNTIVLALARLLQHRVSGRLKLH
jgi:NADH dehydrogenase